MERILARRPGATLTVAGTGGLGIELAGSLRPDLVLLDLHLPDRSGWDVLRAIREAPETKDIPVLIVTADATDGQGRRASQSGADGYVTKPIEIAVFFEVVDDILAARVVGA
ncbi:MAG: response regulator [Chloroflexota bacterium]|nr:response regulator [Chloroflexota bacterium]